MTFKDREGWEPYRITPGDLSPKCRTPLADPEKIFITLKTAHGPIIQAPYVTSSPIKSSGRAPHVSPAWFKFPASKVTDRSGDRRA